MTFTKLFSISIQSLAEFFGLHPYALNNYSGRLVKSVLNDIGLTGYDYWRGWSKIIKKNNKPHVVGFNITKPQDRITEIILTFGEDDEQICLDFDDSNRLIPYFKYIAADMSDPSGIRKRIWLIKVDNLSESLNHYIDDGRRLAKTEAPRAVLDSSGRLS